MKEAIVAAFLAIAVTAQGPPPLTALGGAWQTVRMCAADWNSPRIVCAGPGTSSQQCLEAGCCWDSSNYSLPWCFLPNEPADWDTVADNAWYGSNQASPAAFSSRGGLQAVFAGDVAGVTCGAMAPYVQECDYDGGFLGSGFGFPHALSVNGHRQRAALRFRWSPYGMERRASDTAGTQVSSEVRLLDSEAAVLLTVAVGSLAVGSNATVTAALPLLWRDYSGSQWGWGHPQQPPNVSQVQHTIVNDGTVVLAQDTLSPAVAAASFYSNCSKCGPPALSLAPLGTGNEAGQAGYISWSFTVTDASPISFCFLMYVGRNASNVTAAAAALGGPSFPVTWARAADERDAQWQAAFTPGNSLFSGYLPLLQAGGNVSQAMVSVYYHSIISMLHVTKRPPMLPSLSAADADAAADAHTAADAPYPYTSWTLPSAGPVSAVTAQYLWDTSYASPIWYRLEPAGALQVLTSLLGVGIHQHYAIDTVSLTGVGPWYSFNDLSVFLLIRNYYKYVVAPGGGPDSAAWWTSASLAGRSPLAWLDAVATYWQSLPSIPIANSSNTSSVAGLADYGFAPNLLECVPTYLHGVPSLNAANVMMMNVTADLWQAAGNTTRAAYLRQQAADLLPLVLQQYQTGKGYWACAYPNGSFVPVQHVIDFFVIAESLGPALPPQVQTEMAAFLDTALFTSQWMRALSLSDPAAPASDRSDHGPYGAYAGWPAKTADGLAALGMGQAAAAVFERMLPVIAEGPFGQSHRVYDNDLLPALQTAKSTTDQQYAASVSASIAASILNLAGL